MTIEALDEVGKVVGKSQPLSGNSVAVPVLLQHDPKFSQGVVQLRFTLKNADAFSLRFD